MATPTDIPREDFYCTAQEVIDFLGLNITLSESSDPPISHVEMYVKQAMAELERRCKKAWRVKQYKNLVRDIPQSWHYTRGIPIHLLHTDVLPFDHSQGDRIEAWNGSQYNDVTESVQLVELPRFGKIWVKGYLWAWNREDRLQITYRYKSELTSDVQEACLKLSSVKMIERSFRMKTLAFGGNINPNEIVSRWREDIDNFVAESEEWVVGGL